MEHSIIIIIIIVISIITGSEFTLSWVISAWHCDPERRT